MPWLTPIIETNIAYSSCTLLFGLLVLSVRHRKMAARTMLLAYPRSVGAPRRPAPKRKSAEALQLTATPVQRSGRLVSTAIEPTPREKAIPQASESCTNPIATNENFPILPISNEVKMNSPSFPFENIDPKAFGEISAFGVPATSPTTQDLIPATLAMLSPAEIGNRIEQAVEIPNAAAEANETVSETTAVAEACEPEFSAVEEVAVDPQAPPVASAREKTANDLLPFYGLLQQPFDVTPDPDYLYLSPSHREALASIKDGIENFRGFMVLVAEPGMGKTTLLHKLMEELTDSARVVFLFQTQCTSRELLCFILNELEVDHTGMDVVAMHRALNQALLEEMLQGRQFVLIVDEAQNLQEPVLETIRLLSDFETTHSKLIQIVLAGQPQLAETLTRPSLVQLRQRIAVLSTLKSLTNAETAEYIEHRLRASGWKDNLLFSSEALDQIAESSQGVPRSVNNLCFNSLSESFRRGQEFVEADVVKEVAGKLDIAAFVRPPQASAVSQPAAATAQSFDASELARVLASVLNVQARPNANSEPMIQPASKPEVVLTGNLMEKVRSQGWNKEHEYRILVSLNRDPISGLSVAERYYCCSMYVDEAQAAMLQTGKPVRIKIEQD